MATLANTNISRTVSLDAQTPLAQGDSGMIIEVFRVASGGASGDTTVLVPTLITDIRMVLPNVGASDNLSTTAANTNVTLTLTSGTVTFGAFQVAVIGRR